MPAAIVKRLEIAIVSPGLTVVRESWIGPRLTIAPVGVGVGLAVAVGVGDGAAVGVGVDVEEGVEVGLGVGVGDEVVPPLKHA